MHTSVANAVAARIPMIRFIGARLPRPAFDSSKYPLPSTPAPGNSGPLLTSSRSSTIGTVGSIPRGQGIPESQLPRKFQRQLISEEECEAINTGGAYGL